MVEICEEYTVEYVQWSEKSIHDFYGKGLSPSVSEAVACSRIM